jgi:hypothetical protein
MIREVLRSNSRFYNFNIKRRLDLLDENSKPKLLIAKKLAVRDSKFKINQAVKFHKRFYRIANMSIGSLGFDLVAIRRERYAKKNEVRYAHRNFSNIKYGCDFKMEYKLKEIGKELFKKYLHNMSWNQSLVYQSNNELFVVSVDFNNEGALRITNNKTDEITPLIINEANIENICSNIDVYGKVIEYKKYA